MENQDSLDKRVSDDVVKNIRHRKFFHRRNKYVSNENRTKNFFVGSRKIKNKPEEIDSDFKGRNVLVGVVRNKYQFNLVLDKKFYHIPLSQVNECQFPVKYIAVYQSRKLFGKESGINYVGEVENFKTLKRSQIREIPKDSNDKYVYFKIKKWYKLERPIRSGEMNGVAFSTTMFLIKNSKNITELKIRSRDEYNFYHMLIKTVKRLVMNRVPDHEDIVFRDYTVKLKDGKLYLYFAEVLDCIIGYDVFLQEPFTVVTAIFDYYPEL